MAVLCVFDSIYINSAVNNYKVIFGSVKEHLSKDLFYIIDSNIYQINYELFSDIGSNVIVLNASEHAKTYTSVLEVIEKLQLLGLRRGSTIAAIGGGTIQDIACFISSIYMRGVDWVFMPTTLLSQADSCIGSKSSINTNHTKNLLGTFYPPKLVYIDINFLSTLHTREIKSGVGEIIKIFNLFDQKSLNQLNSDYDLIIEGKLSLEKYIYQALLLKKDIIELDEFDQRERLVMNYGHTFGHAIEKATDYEIPHGIAISFGMDIANYISAKMGFISTANYIWHKKILSKNYLDYSKYPINFEKFFLALDGDKKNTKDVFNFIIYTSQHNIEKYSMPKSKSIENILRAYFCETFQ